MSAPAGISHARQQAAWDRLWRYLLSDDPSESHAEQLVTPLADDPSNEVAPTTEAGATDRGV